MSHLGPFAIPIGVVVGIILIAALGSYRQDSARQSDAVVPPSAGVPSPALKEDALSTAVRTNPNATEVRRRVVESLGGEDSLRNAVRLAADSASTDEQSSTEASLGHKVRVGLDLCFFAVIFVGFLLVLTYEYEVDLIEAAENAFPREAAVLKEAYQRMRADVSRH